MRWWLKIKEERFSPPPWFEQWFPGTKSQWCATNEQRWPFFFLFFYSFFFSFSSIVVQCSIFDICKELLVNFLHFCLCFCPIFCLLSSFHFLLFIFLSLFSLSFWHLYGHISVEKKFILCFSDFSLRKKIPKGFCRPLTKPVG